MPDTHFRNGAFIFASVTICIIRKENIMKKKPIRVTPIMKERMRAEMKRNHQTDQDIADILFISRQQYSRIINGKYNLAPEHLKKLLSVWGVRENYLLGIDSFRSEEDMWDKRSEARKESIVAALKLLNSVGMDFESYEMISFKLPDIQYLKKCGLDTEKLVSAVDPYVCEPRDSWETFKNGIENIKDDNPAYWQEHLFITNGLIEAAMNASLSLAQGQGNAHWNDFVIASTGVYSKIIVDGKFIGYSRKFYEDMDIIIDTVKSLANSLIEIEKRNPNFIIYAENTCEKPAKGGRYLLFE